MADTSSSSSSSSPPGLPLAGQVAVVAGATRGAGRGVARALGEAGAFVYCTGRSVPGQPSPYGRPETIEETAGMIRAAGGQAMAVRVDHAVEPEVAALFARVVDEQGRLDIVVDSVAGEDPLMGEWTAFWDVDLAKAETVLRQTLITRVTTAKHAARTMLKRKRGLIVEITEHDLLFSSGSVLVQIARLAHKGMMAMLATELRPHGIATAAVTPGFLRSERMLEYFGVTEENWRKGGKKDPNFLHSESPLFVGRAVAALAADPHVLQRSGHLFSSWELAREFGFTDADGSRPDWGASEVDFSVLPASMSQMILDGLQFQNEWLGVLAKRTQEYQKKWSAGLTASAARKGA